MLSIKTPVKLCEMKNTLYGVVDADECFVATDLGKKEATDIVAALNNYAAVCKSWDELGQALSNMVMSVTGTSPAPGEEQAKEALSNAVTVAELISRKE